MNGIIVLVNSVRFYPWNSSYSLILLDFNFTKRPEVNVAKTAEYPSSMLARFRVRERNYISVRFIFRISEVRGLPDGLSWLVKDRLTLVQLKTLNSLVCFSQVQNCYPEAFYKCSNNLFASKAPESFRARKAIFRSSVSKNGEVYTLETSCMKGTSLHL